MEQQIKCVRSFWGRCFAMLLGFFSTFGFSSAMAEKLDTTFVLEGMVIDSTPCYYTKYNSAGQITDYGRYGNSSTKFDNSTMFRVNTGYVRNENGDVLYSLYYGCDRVTKQWKQFGLHSGDYLESVMVSLYGGNGMLKELAYSVDEQHIHGSSSTSSTLFTSEGYYMSEQSHCTVYSDDQYDYHDGEECDEYGNVVSESHRSSGTHTGGSYWHRGSSEVQSTYTNTYDKGNLVSSMKIVTEKVTSPYPYDEPEPEPTITEKSKTYEKYFYDSQNRRIKAEIYDLSRDSILTDSIVYSYGWYRINSKGAELESYLTSLSINGVKVDAFAQDKYEYDFPNDYYRSPYVSWKKSLLATSTSSYDYSTNILTITVKSAAYGSSFSDTTSNLHTYRIRFKPYESSLTSLSVDGIKVDTFSSTRYDYVLQCDYNKESFVYELSEGAEVISEIYDDEKKVLTLSLQNTYNPSAQSTYTFRFDPLDGLPVVWGESVNLYADGFTICVDGLHSPVSVYDLMGCMVGSGSGESVRVDVRHSGVYVVLANGQAAKVVVK